MCVMKRTRRCSVFLKLIFEFTRKHSTIRRTTENAFISSKNPFFSISWEKVKESILIFMESDPDRSKNERFRKLSLQMNNDFESRRNNPIKTWNGKECVPSDAKLILVAYESIRQTIEHVLHAKGNFPCFAERVHFRFFPWLFFTGTCMQISRTVHYDTYHVSFFFFSIIRWREKYRETIINSLFVASHLSENFSLSLWIINTQSVIFFTYVQHLYKINSDKRFGLISNELSCNWALSRLRVDIKISYYFFLLWIIFILVFLYSSFSF